MKNSVAASYFLAGCLAGTMVTFLLYFITCYTAPGYDMDTASPELGRKMKWTVQNHVSLSDSAAGAYASVFLSSAAKNYVLPVVFAARNEMPDTLHSVNVTWGAQWKDWAIAVGTKGNRISPSMKKHNHLLLMHKCKDFNRVSLSAEQLFCLLTSLHEARGDQYQWFLVVHRSTYVAVDRLIQFLMDLDPGRVAYLGQRSSYSVEELNKLGLLHHHQVCKLDSGVILSRKALQKIAPLLQHCVGYGISRGFVGPGELVGDVELGRCFSQRLDTTCSQVIEEEEMDLSLFRSFPTQETLSLQKFITLSPIKSHAHLLNVFLRDLSREISSIVQLQNLKTHLARSVCSHLPQSSPELRGRLCTLNFTRSEFLSPRLHPLSTPSNSLFDVTVWEIVVGNALYNSMKVEPVEGLPRVVEQEIQYVVNRSIAIMGGAKDFVPVRLHNVYLYYHGLAGREYILDVEVVERGREGDEEASAEKRVSVVLPHLENLFQVEVRDFPSVGRTVDFVIPLSGVTKRLYDFLTMYEELCLLTAEPCRLNLVVYGHRDHKLIAGQLSALKSKYPDAGLRMVAGSGKFSRGRALNLGLSTLSPSDLVFICDVDMEIEADFLRRCRHNTLRGERVYFPQFFKYYKMEYVYRFTRMPWGRGITRQHGHWATYSYGMLCIYKSDYDAIGGYDSNIEGWGGEDVKFGEHVLGKQLDILRAPDPALSHRYHDKLCSTSLTPQQFAQCISSRNEDLADRTRLAEYIFYLEGRCSIKSWKLWG